MRQMVSRGLGEIKRHHGLAIDARFRHTNPNARDPLTVGPLLRNTLTVGSLPRADKHPLIGDSSRAGSSQKSLFATFLRRLI